MHSPGLELTKLTYTRLEGNLIRHRGDRLLYLIPCVESGAVPGYILEDAYFPGNSTRS